ncbi:protein TEX261-like [Halichondria panicea]|uniref:protein TEX261-like n=1 Tax=Halichondria panicea TaxID=6063 RepID=UPI00312BC36E
MFLWLISWAALLAQVVFVVFSLAAGLYYLAEIIEEYSIVAKKIITYLLVFVIVLYIGLLVFDGFPWGLVVVGLLTHLLYGSLLTTFPVISLLSPGFVGGTLLLIVAHILAFQYFADHWHIFQEVLAFFFLCLWMVPFSFFISLSANDMVLPVSVGSPDGSSRRSRRSMLPALMDFLASKLNNLSPSKSSKSI